jgi:hypothetical protein
MTMARRAQDAPASGAGHAACRASDAESSMKRGLLLLLVGIGALAVLGVALGQTAVVAVVVATATLAGIGARECRASLGDALRKRIERRLGPVPLAPGSTLVAVVCPDQLEDLPELIARASADSNALVVLAIEPSAAGELVIPRAAPELLHAESPRVRLALGDALARAHRPITFMTATGRDIASVTLDVARRIAAREVLALSADRGGADEAARRAARVWEGLPAPKPPLSVRLVISEGRDDRRVQLAADPPISPG